MLTIFYLLENCIYPCLYRQLNVGYHACVITKTYIYITHTWDKWLNESNLRLQLIIPYKCLPSRLWIEYIYSYIFSHNTFRRAILNCIHLHEDGGNGKLFSFPTRKLGLVHNRNPLRPGQNGKLIPDDIFKWIVSNENVGVSIKISFEFVPRSLISNIPALVQIIAWHRPSRKPLSVFWRTCFTR